MAAQQSKQKTNSPSPPPPPAGYNNQMTAHESTIAKSIGGLEGMEKLALQKRFGFATHRDTGTQLGMWCVPTMAEREEDEERETGRTKERKTRSPPGTGSLRTGPSNPCTRSGLRAYHTPVLCRRRHTRPAFERVRRARNRARDDKRADKTHTRCVSIESLGLSINELCCKKCR
jgi:hypothetical protein